MSNGNSLINLGELSKPATVLIEKISDAIGGIFRPHQIKRIAKAEAEAEKIKALAQIDISDIQQRALVRLIQEEGKKQENIESITAQSIQELRSEAKPEAVDNDWIANFFDKCKLVSDKEMQSLWARLLAGEANVPGTISKRTIELVSSLDKSDAHLFTSLCGFGWAVGDVIPLIYDAQNEIYTKRGINFSSLTHLDDIGLLTFDNIAGFIRQKVPKHITVFYYGTPVTVELQNDQDNELDIGHVLLSKTGRELAPICGSRPIPEFIDYVLGIWKGQGYKIIGASSLKT